MNLDEEFELDNSELYNEDIEINFHDGQSEVFSDLFIEKTVRHAVVRASRGYGKSFLAAGCALKAVDELLDLAARVPNKTVYIIAPTYDQVTEIYYPLLQYQLGAGQYANKSSRDAGVFWYPNDIQLRLMSFEAIERMRGKGAYFVANDEPASWVKGVGLKEAWEGIIQPCIVTRWSEKRARELGAESPGRSLTIGTPKGYDYFYEMNNFHEVDSDWKTYHYDYTKSPYLDEKEIEKIKARIDPLQWNREYLAQFKGSGLNVFYTFNREIHVRKDVPDFKPGETVHAAIDFNVGIQATSFWAIRGSQAHCIDEIQGHPDTETLALYIAAKYHNHKVICYPDPTGNSNKSSAPTGQTDFTILRDAKLTVCARSSSPGLVNSANCVNRMLLTASGKVSTYLHPRCVGTINSLEKTSWLENTDNAVINKKAGTEHFSDGVRYFFEYNWPIVANVKRVAKGSSF
jgi:hypothetical protein